MMLTTFVFLLLGLNLCKVLGQEEEWEECGGTGSCIVWDDVCAALQYYSRCSYPTNKLNSSCILTSCPSLSGVCPLTSNGSINQTALSTAVSILNTCIAQNSLVCGINMSRTPVSLLAWSLKQLVPPEVASGTVSIVPGTGFLYNLSTAKFSAVAPQRNSPITLLIRAPNIIHMGTNACNLRVLETSILHILPITFLTIPNMAGIIHVNLSLATVSIDLSTSPSPTIKTLDSQCDVHSEFTNFTSEMGAPVPCDVVQPFNDMMKSFLQDSPISSTTINFLSTYAALALLAAQLNCPMNNN